MILYIKYYYILFIILYILIICNNILINSSSSYDFDTLYPSSNYNKKKNEILEKNGFWYPNFTTNKGSNINKRELNEINVINRNKIQEEIKNNNIIFFLHLHKCGGTHMCFLVNKNKIPIISEQRKHNCNLIGDGPNTLILPSLPPFGKFNNCEEKLEFMKKNHIKFVAIERYFDPMICPGFTYTINLRETISRIYSNARFESHTKEEVMQWATEKGYVYTDTRAIKRGTAVIDNFLVRTLGGKDIYFKELGTLTEKDYELAKSRLEQFKLIIILEEYRTTSKQLSILLGWKLWFSHSTHGKMKWEFNEEELQFIQDLNQYDMRLYEYGRQLALNRTALIT